LKKAGHRVKGGRKASLSTPVRAPDDRDQLFRLIATRRSD
jgi:hypothetical protein